MENFKMVCLIAVAIAVHVAKRHAAHVWSQRVLVITLAIAAHCGALDILLDWSLVVCQCSFAYVIKEECLEHIKVLKVVYAAI